MQITSKNSQQGNICPQLWNVSRTKENKSSLQRLPLSVLALVHNRCLTYDDVCGYPHQLRKIEKQTQGNAMGCNIVDVLDASLPSQQRKSHSWRLHPFHEIVGFCALLADLARVPSNMVFVLLWLLSAGGGSKLTDSLHAHQHFVRGTIIINSLLCLEAQA